MNDALRETKLSLETGEPTEELIKIWQALIASEWIKRFPEDHFLREDCEAQALYTLTKVWRVFNTEKSDNPRAWYIQIIWGSFLESLAKEKRQQEI